MARATIQVKYVNQPREGMKNGSVKTAEGVLYGVPPPLLPQFQPGGTYNVEYNTSQFQGRTYSTISAASAMVQSGAPLQSGSKFHANDETAERIFVCGIINAAVGNGSLSVNRAELVAAVSACREAWQAAFGRGHRAMTSSSGDTIPSGQASSTDNVPLNDEIPF